MVTITSSSRTKYAKDNRLAVNSKEDDRPIVIDKAQYDDTDDVRQFLCPWYNLILYARRTSKEVYCQRCKTFTDIKPSKTQEVQTIEDPNKVKQEETLVSTIPDTDMDTYIKKPPSFKGGFAALSNKGTMRITDYQEKGGDNRTLG
jgi:hypothetical protein